MSVSLVENTSRFDLEILTISLNRLVFSDTELLSYLSGLKLLPLENGNTLRSEVGLLHWGESPNNARGYDRPSQLCWRKSRPRGLSEIYFYRHDRSVLSKR